MLSSGFEDIYSKFGRWRGCCQSSDFSPVIEEYRRKERLSKGKEESREVGRGTD
jgi:hypothetical protein